VLTIYKTRSFCAQVGRWLLSAGLIGTSNPPIANEEECLLPIRTGSTNRPLCAGNCHMAYEVDMAPEYALGIVRLADAVDGDTLLAALNTLYDGDNWVPEFNAVWDARAITELSVLPREADRILERMTALCKRMGQGRTVVVAPREIDALFFRMLFVRNVCAFRERKIVYDLDGAIAWLDERYPDSVRGVRRYMASHGAPRPSAA